MVIFLFIPLLYRHLLSLQYKIIRDMNDIYTPSAIVNCYSNALKVDLETMIVTLQGIYKPDPQNKVYNGLYYDRLVEQDNSFSITIKVKPYLRNYLLENRNKLITLSGFLSRKLSKLAAIEVSLTVSGICKSESNDLSQDEMDFWEIQRKKAQSGRKDISLSLRSDLMSNNKPKVALVWAFSSCTKTEFFNALGNANMSIDFEEFGVNFGNVKEIVSCLKNLDGNYRAIALIRGGGSGLDVFNNNDLLNCLVSMSSPIISAIGHAEEKHNVKLIADLVIDTPTALGKYFSDIVEKVIAEKEHSKAVLIDSVKKQFSNQLIVQQKQIEDLQRRLSVASEENKKSLTTFNNQVSSLQQHVNSLTKEAEKKDAFIRQQEVSYTNEITKINATHLQQLAASSNQIEQLQVQLKQADLKVQQEAERVTSVYKLQNESLTSQLKGLTEDLQSKATSLSRLQAAQTNNVSVTVLVASVIGAALVGMLLASILI